MPRKREGILWEGKWQWEPGNKNMAGGSFSRKEGNGTRHKRPTGARDQRLRRRQGKKQRIRQSKMERRGICEKTLNGQCSRNNMKKKSVFLEGS